MLSGERQNVFGKAVWLYFRFSRSFRDVEALLAQRGIDLGYETIWFCIIKVGPLIARRLEKRLGSPTPGWHLGCCQRYARKLETARRCSCDLWRLLKARSRSVRPGLGLSIPATKGYAAGRLIPMAAHSLRGAILSGPPGRGRVSSP